MCFVDNPTEPHERKKDPHLWDNLKSEAEGILTWLVAGCIEWRKNGLNPPEIITRSTNEYRTSEDILQQFIDDACLVGPGYTANAQPLYDHYKSWMTENGLKPLSGTKFGTKMGERLNKDKSRNGVIYQDIEIINNVN